LSLVHEGKLGILDLLKKLTCTPADLLGLDAGRLLKGAPADLILFDPESPRRLRIEDLISLSKNTPFEGRLLQGKVMRTLVDGRTIFDAEAA
jgi:dihydroorotase